MTGRERVIARMEGRPVDRLPLMPITMMFASARAGIPYRRYATDHRAMAEAQIRVAEEFGFDQVSTISDPAREAADLGAAVEWFDDQPPAMIEASARLADKTELARLPIPDPLGGGRMHDRVQGVALLRARVGADKAVEGWVEGPCAEAADLRGINTLMTDFIDDPAFVRDLFAFIVEMGLAFARPQVEAGADYIGIGDAAASLIGPRIYEEFVWPYEKKLIDGLHAMGTRVRLHICGKTRRLYPGMGRLGANLIDLDYFAPVDEARAVMGPAQALLGNLDPLRVVRNGTPQTVTAAIAECHLQAGANFAVGAGCELVRDTPAENVRAMAAYAFENR
jgi:MtaA/CmuA family methyltransferase